MKFIRVWRVGVMCVCQFWCRTLQVKQAEPVTEINTECRQVCLFNIYKPIKSLHCKTVLYHTLELTEVYLCFMHTFCFGIVVFGTANRGRLIWVHQHRYQCLSLLGYNVTTTTRAQIIIKLIDKSIHQSSAYFYFTFTISSPPLFIFPISLLSSVILPLVSFLFFPALLFPLYPSFHL